MKCQQNNKEHKESAVVSQESNFKRIILLRINPEEDILSSLRQAAKDHDIQNAVILAGIGSARRSHFHVVTSNELPPAEGFSQSEQPLDVIALQGLIIDGRVHAHITFSDERNGFGGHLEEGCVALTFMLVTLGELSDADIAGWDAPKKRF
jgi:predicted DNA-binding protein with PD1-like motif